MEQNPFREINWREKLNECTAEIITWSIMMLHSWSVKCLHHKLQLDAEEVRSLMFILAFLGLVIIIILWLISVILITIGFKSKRFQLVELKLLQFTLPFQLGYHAAFAIYTVNWILFGVVLIYKEICYGRIGASIKDIQERYHLDQNADWLNQQKRRQPKSKRIRVRQESHD